MKTQELLQKAPKKGAPVSIKTLKGGCRYFTVWGCPQYGLFLERSFVVCGKPFRTKKFCDFLVIRAKGGVSCFGVVFLSDSGVLPHQHSFSLRRTFRYTEKVLKFYQDLVVRQDMEAYKEAIAGTI